MNRINPFAEKYKTFSNFKLIEILENQTDYQPEAVEAAKHEIERRNLSDEEILKIKSELIKIKQCETQQDFGKKLTTIVNKLISLLHILQQKSVSRPEHLIKRIVIVLFIVTVSKWYLAIMPMMPIREWDDSIIILFFPNIFLSLSVFLLWLKKQIGWILMTIYLNCSIISSLVLMLTFWNVQPSVNSVFNVLIPQNLMYELVISIIFSSAVLLTLNREDIRHIYSISKKTATIIMLASSILASLFFITLSHM